MRQFGRPSVLGVTAGAALVAGVIATAAPAQNAPLPLGAPAPQATPVPPKPIAQTPPKPAAATAAKPAAAAAKPAKPVAKPVTGTADAAPKKPAKTVSPAQKVPPAARAAIALAAKTGQAVPPEHHHVSKANATTCTNPDALGVSRVLEVDTTDGLYLGQLYHGRLPLEPKEIVLTFDDGPVPRNTERVLAALDKECVKATYFIVGQMAKAYPETLRKVAAAGHTIGYHTMTHPLDMVKRPLDWAKGNITSGWQTVDQILYGQATEKPATPFFRYPGLFNSRQINEWFNGMGVGVFAADATGNDWIRSYNAEGVMNFALKDLERAGSTGILLLHDTKDTTATMVPTLLRELKARGYKVVHLVPKQAPPALVAGPVQGQLPLATAAPLAQRNLAGFDSTRQLIQNAQGRNGDTTKDALPSYDSAGMAKALGTGGEGRSGSDGRTGSVTPVTAATAASATAPSAEQGWFASTATSFRGIGSAIGLW